MKEHDYYVYLLTNPHHTVIYTGVTRDLVTRVAEHRLNVRPGFTSRYNCKKLVYFEHFTNVNEAIQREKQIKSGSRRRKIDLINKLNPSWQDLWEYVKDDVK